jgi:Ca2+-transporting ATPase
MAGTPPPGWTWHHPPADEVLDLLGVDPRRGLSPAEVVARRAQFGPNRMPAPRGPSTFALILRQFNQSLIIILIVAAAVAAALGEFIDAGVILGVVVINAGAGFLHEARATRALEALQQTVVSTATVLRSGRRGRISSEDLVPGDIVFVEAGQKVPADIRLIDGKDIAVDESALTGESVPAAKHPQPLEPGTILPERGNMLYASTLVTSGSGMGVVVAIGGETEVGRIARLMVAAPQVQTPLGRRISRFSRLILVLILATAAITFAVGLVRGEPFEDMFLASVALAVAAIPEGLPAALTITLAIGVSRMARRRAIIRRLPAVETLGSTTVICSDKTGTLTQNQMTVLAAWAGGATYELTGSGYDPAGRIEAPPGGLPLQRNVALDRCLLAGAACNDAHVVHADGRWTVVGDPTEGALLVAGRKAGFDEETLKTEYPRVDTVPFDSANQYMATLHRVGRGGAILFAKGSVEAITARCADALAPDGGHHPLALDEVHRQVADMAGRGLRVLAFAAKELPAGTRAIGHDDLDSLTFLGLQGMLDPPRPEAIVAVAACHSAGITVKMVTGDHARTAAAIAAQIGIVAPGGDETAVVTGQQIDEADEADLPALAAGSNVFARVTPHGKLRLVRALQSRGEVVAMTGDGVNDAPALRQADIGVAMGLGGTDVAREAGDMVLTDDNFATIEAAVEEGRCVNDNLTKFIAWTLPTNVGQGLVIFVAVLAGLTLPVLPVQILWINMMTAVLLGLTLAFEPPEPGIMQRPPRDPAAAFLSRQLVVRTVVVGLLLVVGAFAMYEWALTRGASDEAARTVAVNVFIVVQSVYLVGCRSLILPAWAVGLWSNRWVPAGIAAMLLLQLAFTYVPFMNTIFRSAPVDWEAWAITLPIAAAVFAFGELEKWLRRSGTYHLLGQRLTLRP